MNQYFEEDQEWFDIDAFKEHQYNLTLDRENLGREKNMRLVLLGLAVITFLVLYLTRVVKDNHSDVMMSFDEMADLINVRA